MTQTDILNPYFPLLEKIRQIAMNCLNSKSDIEERTNLVGLLTKLFPVVPEPYIFSEVASIYSKKWEEAAHENFVQTSTLNF